MTASLPSKSSYFSETLADELAIGAMQRALADLSPGELNDIGRRAQTYLAAPIPLHDIYRLDATALAVERIRRRAFGELAPLSEVA